MKAEFLPIVGNTAAAISFVAEATKINVSRQLGEVAVYRHTMLKMPAGRLTPARSTAVWLRANPMIFETAVTRSYLQARGFSVTGNTFGALSTGASLAQTFEYGRRGQVPESAMAGADSGVGVAMLIGGPGGVAFGLGYFGTRLVHDGAAYFGELVWPEQSVMELP